MGVRRLFGLAGCRQAGRRQSAGRAPLDQGGPHAVPAIGVGKAGADHHRRPLLRQPGRPLAYLERHLQSAGAGGRAHGAGAHPARSWNHSYLHADFGGGPAARRHELEAGAHPGHMRCHAGGRRLVQRQAAQALSKGAAYELYQP